MPDHGLKFFRWYLSCIAQIYLMMEPLSGKIEHITLLLRKAVHDFNRSRFVIIRTGMHALHAKAFVISKEFGF